MAPWRQAGLPPDATMVLSTGGVWVQQITEKVRPTLLGVLRSSFTRQTGEQPPPGFDQSQYAADYLNESVNRMSNTPDSVYREITSIVARGIEQGDPLDRIVRRVDGFLQVSGVDWWEQRAMVVARTEAAAATNAGVLAAGGVQAAAEGRPWVKEWRADLDDRTRLAHRAADGQTVPLTAPFIVGGEPLQYPGDPRGSAENVIQCRCELSVRAAGEE